MCDKFTGPGISGGGAVVTKYFFDPHMTNSKNMRNFAPTKVSLHKRCICAVMAFNLYYKAFSSTIFIQELLLRLKQREEKSCRQFTLR